MAGVLTAVFSGLVGVTPVQAQEETAQELDAVVVTATGRLAAVRDVQASVEVLERERLERYGEGSVAQALKHAAGVQASDGGASGDVSIRGFNRNHSLILVDGFRRTNNYGSSNPSQIGFFDVERIEIVRGPLSSLYGSDALGGVVNVITRHPGENPGTTLFLQTGVAEGGRETLRSGVNMRTGDARLGHSFTLEQNFRDALRHRASLSDERSHLRNWSGSYRGRWSPDAGQSLGWAVEFFDRHARTGVDATAPTAVPPSAGVPAHHRYEQERRHFGSLDYRRQIGDGELVLRASAGRSRGETTRSYPVVEKTDYRQYQGDAIYHFAPHEDHWASLGVGALRDELDVSINRRKAERSNRFLLLQDQWQIHPQWQLVAGVRVDDFDDFGSTVNPRVSLGWSEGAWSARIGYGTGFRAPSLLEQYSSFVRGRSQIRGNSALKPEESKSWEAMLRREFSRGYVELTLHRNRIDQLIESVNTGQTTGACPGAACLAVIEYQNVSKAKIGGLELQALWQFGANWSLGGGLDLLDARDAHSDKRLRGRAIQTWRLELIYERGPLEVALRGRHMRNYLAAGIDAPRVNPPPPHNTRLSRVDLGLSYAWSDGVKLMAGIENLFDQRDPDNFSVTSTGTHSNDPDARYGYIGARIEF